MSPVFEPATHTFDTIAASVTTLIVANDLIAGLTTWDAGLCPPVFQTGGPFTV